MVDIQTASVMLASASVVAGIIYYSLQIRNQARARQTDLTIRLYSLFINREWLDAWQKVYDSIPDMTDSVTYYKKHGTSDFNQIYLTFELLGILLENKLIKMDFLDRIAHDHVVTMWEKVKPMIEDAKKVSGLRTLGAGTEYLYNEMKKREQKSQPTSNVE
jgi:hypothetical protein